MAGRAREVFDAIIVGGGIAGSALATVLARAGRSVLVLERSEVYRDRVRGEYVQPWGVAEAIRLGLHRALLGAGGVHHTRFVPYDETVAPAEAVANAVAVDRILPAKLGVAGTAATLGLTARRVSPGGRRPVWPWDQMIPSKRRTITMSAIAASAYRMLPSPAPAPA